MDRLNVNSEQAPIDIIDLAASPSVSKRITDGPGLETMEVTNSSQVDDLEPTLMTSTALSSTDAPVSASLQLPEVNIWAPTERDLGGGDNDTGSNDGRIDKSDGPPIESVDHLLPPSTSTKPEEDQRSVSSDSDDFCSCASTADIEESVMSLRELDTSPRNSRRHLPEETDTEEVNKRISSIYLDAEIYTPEVTNRLPSLYLDAVEGDDNALNGAGDRLTVDRTVSACELSTSSSAFEHHPPRAPPNGGDNDEMPKNPDLLPEITVELGEEDETTTPLAVQAVPLDDLIAGSYAESRSSLATDHVTTDLTPTERMMPLIVVVDDASAEAATDGSVTGDLVERTASPFGQEQPDATEVSKQDSTAMPPPERKRNRIDLVQFAASPAVRKPRTKQTQPSNQSPEDTLSVADSCGTETEVEDVELATSLSVVDESTSDVIEPGRGSSDTNNNVDQTDGTQGNARVQPDFKNQRRRPLAAATTAAAAATVQPEVTQLRIDKKPTASSGTNRVREQAQNINKIASGNLPAGRSAVITGKSSAVPNNKNSRLDVEATNAGSRNSSNFVEFQLTDSERKWLLSTVKSDYQAMARLLVDDQSLAVFRDPVTGRSALHWAAQNGKPEVVKLVLGTKAAKSSKPPIVECRSRDAGLTALHLAAINARYDVIELLCVGYGANREPVDFSGRRPINYLMTSLSSSSSYRIDPSMTDATFTTGFQRSVSLLKPAKPNPLLGPVSVTEIGPSSFASSFLQEAFGGNRQMSTVASRETGSSSQDQKSGGSMSTIMRGLNMTTPFGPSIAVSSLHHGASGGDHVLPPRELPAMAKRQTVTSLKRASVDEGQPSKQQTLTVPGQTVGGRKQSAGDDAPGYLSDSEQVSASRRIKGRNAGGMKATDSSPNFGTLI